MKEEKTKKQGQIFTPCFIVEEMLDYIGYNGNQILSKHIIDNSCGDGAFLKSIVRRYINVAKEKHYTVEQIKADLEIYVHGIDIDNVAFTNCLENLSSITQESGISNIKWDIYNQDSLNTNKFNSKMDYVIGNPPYVRVHNLDASYEEVKNYNFANGGMTDLYLAFFELGFNMLNSNGKLCYITPSSWLNSLAALNMRKFILRKGNLVSLTDLEHFQAFENATTYTLISLFDNQKRDDKFDYFTFDPQTRKRNFVDKLSLYDSYIDNYFYLSDKINLQLLKDIKTKKSSKFVSVKNGFATLADKVFIGDNIPESDITIKTLKASTGKWYKCIFPYNKKGKLLTPEEVFANHKIKEHFESHKQELLKGKTEFSTYYEYGRTQALLDVWKDKLAINTLVRTIKDMKVEEVKYGQGIYSGLYIINDFNIPNEDIKNILLTDDFINYVHLLKKYKSGGYYTFNSKDVEQYINYYFTHITKKNYDDKQRIFR